MDKVIIVHMWDASSKDAWYPWLKKVLESKGFEVIIPDMPETSTPKIENWVSTLSKIVTPETILVGHSIGCQTILRTLENSKARAAVLVAPWLTLRGLESEKEKEIANPWIKNKIDFKKVKNNCKKFTAIFSDDDPYVSLDNLDKIKKELGANCILEKNKVHFTDKSYSIILNEVLIC